MIAFNNLPRAVRLLFFAAYLPGFFALAVSIFTGWYAQFPRAFFLMCLGMAVFSAVAAFFGWKYQSERDKR